MEKLLQIKDGVIEVHKNIVYQQNHKSKYLVIYSILLQWEEVDYQLQELGL